MMHRLIKILTASAGKSKWILDAVCILFCLMMLVPIAGCFANNSKPDEVVKTDQVVNSDAVINTAGNGYSVKNLDFCKVSDKETCQLLSIDSAYNTIAVSVLIWTPPISTNLSREMVLLYDLEGKLRSQISLDDAIGTDKTIRDVAIDAEGNLVVYARTQSDDKVIHNYLYSLDSEGKLTGDPIELTFEKSILPLSFIIGTDGKMYFTEMALGGHIYVFDSTGNKLFVISETHVTGNLYQMGDVIYTDSKTGGANSSEGAKLLPIDTESRNLGDSIDISKVTSSGGAIYAGSDGFYLLNAEGIYSINLDSQDTRELILWKDVGVDWNIGRYLGLPAAVISKDKILICSNKTTEAEGVIAVNVSLLTRE